MGRSYETYLEHLAVHNYAAHTITGRRLALIAFLRWCQERDLFRPQDVTRPVLESYQRWMHRHRKKNGNPLGFTTQRGRLVAIKDYFRWLCRQNLILHNPASELEMPRNERKLPKGALNESEIERILSQPDISQPLGIRDRAMLETLYSTGIRRTELVRLELGDLNPERGVLMVRQGQGQKGPLRADRRARPGVDRQIPCRRAPGNAARSEGAGAFPERLRRQRLERRLPLPARCRIRPATPGSCTAAVICSGTVAPR